MLLVSQIKKEIPTEIAKTLAQHRERTMKHNGLVSARIAQRRIVAGLAIAAALAAWSAFSASLCAAYGPISGPRQFFVSSADDIRMVMEIAQPGDTLIMQNGFWTDQDITFEGDGTADLPITLRAETPGQVILNGSSRLRIAGSFLVVDSLYFKDGNLNEFGDFAVVAFRRIMPSVRVADHCRLTNSVIENYNPPDIADQYNWVSLYGTSNRVDHSTFKGKTNVGGLLLVRRPAGGAQFHQIDHNYFVDRPSVMVLGAGEPLHSPCIGIGNSGDSMSDSFTTVESNLFERCNGGIEAISNKSGHNVFRSNTFKDSEGTLTLRHGNGALVEGNFFFGDNITGTGGVRIIGEDHVIINNYFTGIAGISSTQDIFRPALDVFDGVEDSPLNGYFQVKRAVIAFNTFVDNERNIVIGGGRTSLGRQFPGHRIFPPLDSTIANNVVVQVTHPRTHCLINVVDEPINMTYEGDIMFGDCLGIDPVPEGINIIDPMLVLADDGLYRPDRGSPLIDSSVGDYPMVTIDMDGQPRDDDKDVGADEVSDAPITRRPLTPADVGANWLLRP